jgi:hypothetical protein
VVAEEKNRTSVEEAGQRRFASGVGPWKLVAFRWDGMGYAVGRANCGQILVEEWQNCTLNRHEEGTGELKLEMVAMRNLVRLDMDMVEGLVDVEMVACVVDGAIACMELAALVCG